MIVICAYAGYKIALPRWMRHRCRRLEAERADAINREQDDLNPAIKRTQTGDERCPCARGQQPRLCHWLLSAAPWGRRHRRGAQPRSRGSGCARSSARSSAIAHASFTTGLHHTQASLIGACACWWILLQSHRGRRSSSLAGWKATSTGNQRGRSRRCFSQWACQRPRFQRGHLVNNTFTQTSLFLTGPPEENRCQDARVEDDPPPRFRGPRAQGASCV